MKAYSTVHNTIYTVAALLSKNYCLDYMGLTFNIHEMVATWPKVIAYVTLSVSV